MTTQRSNPPIWMMGLTDITFGMVMTFSVTTVPQILAEQGVSGGHIAAITAVILSPGWWAFLFAPMLDVRFRRQTYALVLGFLAALGAAFIAFDHHNLLAIEIAAFTCILAVSLYQGAVGGWMGSLIEKEQDGLLSSWFIGGGIAAGGIMAMAGEPVILHCPPILAAALIFVVITLPMAFFLFIPAPQPDKLLAAESFGRFWREVLSLFKRSEVLIGMVLFVLPSASFALTNVLAGIGKDYQASSTMVSSLAGAGYVIAGIAGLLLVPRLAKKLPLRPLYLGIGVVGALFTLSTLLLPRSPFALAVVFTGEILFQTLAFAVATGIMFEIIGRDNPLAATTFTLLTSVMFVPTSYMAFVDGWGYDKGGLIGSFAVDAGFGIAACLLLAIMLRRWLFAPRLEAEPV
ncbi:MAG: MFS transporter [Acidobacteriaceae bacterium]